MSDRASGGAYDSCPISDKESGPVFGVILLGPGEVFVLIIITAIVVLLAVRGRNVNK